MAVWAEIPPRTLQEFLALAAVNGGAKVRRVAGRSKSAAPHRELREYDDCAVSFHC